MTAASDRPPQRPARIVAALDRLSRALRAHRQTTASRLGVTPLQLELLIAVADGPPPTPVVGLLARELGVSQPTATDSLRALERKGLLNRDTADDDRRRVTVSLTDAGSAIVDVALADTSIIAAVARLPASAQNEILASLHTVIARFVRDDVIIVARTCLTCRFHRRAGDVHHCDLLGTDLRPDQLRVNCPEHESATATLKGS